MYAQATAELLPRLTNGNNYPTLVIYLFDLISLEKLP